MIKKTSLFNIECFIPLCLSYFFYTQILSVCSVYNYKNSIMDSSICSNNSMCNLKFALHPWKFKMEQK